MKTGCLTLLILGLLAGPTTILSQQTRDSSGSKARIGATAQQQKKSKKKPPPDFVAYEKAPEVIKKIDPHYPEIALRAGLEGNVLLRVWVGESGKVEDVQIIRSDQKIFEQAASLAAREWKFTPAMIGEKPVEVWVTIPFRFRVPLPTEGKSREDSVFVSSLQDIVFNIIRGQNINDAKSSIAQGAYVIDGNHYESLWAVLNGESKTCKVVDGPDAKIPFFHTAITDDRKSAYIVLKTVSVDGKHERYHSVVLFRQPQGDWRIESWHVSG